MQIRALPAKKVCSKGTTRRWLRIRPSFLWLFFSWLLIIQFNGLFAEQPCEGLDLPILLVQTIGRGITNRFRTPVNLLTLSPHTNNFPSGQSPLVSQVRSPNLLIRGQAGSGDNSFTFTHPERAKLWLRGNSSAVNPKKPYRLQLEDSHGHPMKAGLLGMPMESDWILYPAYTDKTLFRDVLGYELWRAMGHYAVRCRYVELFIKKPRSEKELKWLNELNWLRDPLKFGIFEARHPATGTAWNVLGEMDEEWTAVCGSKPVKEGFSFHEMNAPPGLGSCYLTKAGIGSNGVTMADYEGVYILMEKIKRGKHRLNIQKLRPEDSQEPEITGGYIFKKDRLNPGEHGFKSTQGIEFAFEEPKERDITPAQVQWLSNYVNEFERVLFNDNFADPVTGYAKYIDVDSFIDYHWMVEATRNIDGYWFSQFYHKDRGGKLAMGPIWDWDISFGNAFYAEGYKTNGWRWQQLKNRDYLWFGRLFEDPDFLQKYIDRWALLRTNVFATSNILARIDGWAAELSHAQERNYSRWRTLGKNVHPNQFVGATYADEVNWLKNWIIGRLAWIDSQGFPAPEVSFAEDWLDDVRIAEMRCQVGKIYYSLDGSDPRLSGGSISPKALEYSVPIRLAAGDRLCARVRSEYGLWSPKAAGFE